MSKATNAFVESNQDRFLEELKTFLRIPSISTLPEHASDIRRAAEFVADSLRDAGLRKRRDHPDRGQSAGLRRLAARAGQADRAVLRPLRRAAARSAGAEWITPPFEPDVRDGNIYARGSADDKGQMYMHIKAVEALRAVNGTLPVNVKFLIEGRRRSRRRIGREIRRGESGETEADVALVSDTELYAEGIPTLCIGLRGLIYTEIEARGPARDLHSGLYGGAAPNAVFGLIELLSKFKDAERTHP